jgi:hypothetical protein
MLYIIDIDNHSFATSSDAIEPQSVYPKLFYATSVNNYEDPDNPLVTIKHKEDGSSLVNSYPILEITLDGTVYTDKEDFVSEFNALMNSGSESSGGALEDVVTELEEVVTELEALNLATTGMAADIAGIETDVENIAADVAVIEADTALIKANQTNGTQKAQNVDAAGITAETIPDVFALTITRPANTTAYTAGDVIGDVSAALDKFVNVSKANGYAVIITNVRLQTNDTGFAGKVMNIHFHNDTVAAIADNAAFAIVDAEASKRRGKIQVTFGTGIYGREAEAQFENLLIVPVARDIPIILETVAAATPSANSTWFRIEIGVLLCN